MSGEEAAAIAAIGAQVEGLARRFDEHAQRTQRDLAEIKIDLKETKSEVKRTNGRVTDLEIESAAEDGASKARRGLLSVGAQVVLLAATTLASLAAIAALFLH